MRTRSGSDYQALPPKTPSDSIMPLQMDALDAAITSLVDTAGPVTTEALAALLRGLASTLTTTFNELIAKKDDQILALQARLTVVEERGDDLEQYSRRNTVRIRGIAESANEDTDGLVKDLAARKLQVNIGDVDIDRSHRVGRRSDEREANGRDIIVRFTSHNTKSAIMRNARKLKGTRLFINEDMTKIRATMAWEARCLKRDNKLIDTWTRDGVIFTKSKDNKINSITTQRAWKEFKERL